MKPFFLTNVHNFFLSATHRKLPSTECIIPQSLRLVHEGDLYEWKIIILQQKWLIPYRFVPLSHLRISIGLLVDSYSHIVLKGMPVPLRFDVAVDEGQKDNWMKSEHA